MRRELRRESRKKGRTPDEVLSDAMAQLRADPLRHVMFSYPWDTEQAIQRVRLPEEYRARFPGCEFGPDRWACQLLDELAAEIKERGFDRLMSEFRSGGGDGIPPSVQPIQFATVSGHEIGKSTLVAWLVKFILDTRPFSRGTVTAMTDEQLRTKTWAEVGKWHRLSLTEHWFQYSATRGNMTLVSKSHPEEWRADARRARKESTESFAGQHAPGATSFYIFDEASGIEPELFRVRRGGLSSGEPMIFDFGNGTRSSGEFFDECEGRRPGFIHRSIDSRDVAITNKEFIQGELEDYGGGDEDSDYFRVRWRGMFPKTGLVQFIQTPDVLEAMEREAVEDRMAALVLGVDVARKGADSSVIWPRRGRDARSFEPVVIDGYDQTVVFDKIVEMFNMFRSLGTPPSMIFVDEGNTGGAIVDFLRKAGYPVRGVLFGSTPTDRVHWRYHSDEIWGKLRTAIQEGLRLPARNSRYGERIFTEMTTREYGFAGGTDRLHLETKDMLRARGLPSPDFTDALACTYDSEVNDLPTPYRNQGQQVESDWDPFAPLDKES